MTAENKNIKEDHADAKEKEKEIHGSEKGMEKEKKSREVRRRSEDRTPEIGERKEGNLSMRRWRRWWRRKRGVRSRGERKEGK